MLSTYVLVNSRAIFFCYARLHSRFFENSVGADAAEETDFSLPMKGEAVSVVHSSLPNIPGILHLFHIQRWVPWVFEQLSQLLVGQLLNIFWKRFIVFFEFREIKRVLLSPV